MTLALIALCAGLTGCAAITNPVAHGIPVRMLPPELLAERKDDKETIPLTMLRQPVPSVYRLAAEDVLGVYIEGVLGEREQGPPVSFPDAVNQPPALGFPIPVREDGTLPLPLIDPVDVNGLTIAEAQDKILRAYTTDRAILQADRARIIVTLIRPRQIRVLVIRQDSPTASATLRTGGVLSSTRGSLGGGELVLGGNRKGTGTRVDLPAYENDVLSALARTGGLPGLDAANEVIVQRADYSPNGQPVPPDARGLPPQGPGRIVHIPLRWYRGAAPPFGQEDVILQTGDIVFVEARETEVYYASGLLPAGEYPLPRDIDLTVTEAIAQIGGPMVNGGINSNNLSGTIVQAGIGFPSPSLLSVLRKAPNGRQVTIRVDLNEALRDPREDLIVAPGDKLILQETPGEAFGRYFTNVFSVDLFGRFINRQDAQGAANLLVP
jgi:hypothetical protein